MPVIGENTKESTEEAVKTNTGETTDEEGVVLDIDFNETSSNDFIEIFEDDLFNFFVLRTFKSKFRVPFTVSKIKGPDFVYKDFCINFEQILSLSFIFPKVDPRPFIIVIEDYQGAKKFYSQFKSFRIRWTVIDELSGISAEVQQQLLLDVVKREFKRFFHTELRLEEYVIRELSYTYFDVKYELKKEQFLDNYNKYCFVPDKAHSISKVYVSGHEAKIEKEMNFVKNFCVYYSYFDVSTPLMIETEEYKIGDKVPLYDYLTRKSIYSQEWETVDCGSNLVRPKCDQDIRRILDQVVYDYRMQSVHLDINDNDEKTDGKVLKKLSHVPFIYSSEFGENYLITSYVPTFTKSFFIERVTVNAVTQRIEVESREFNFAYIIFTKEDINKPVLLGFKLNSPPNVNRSRHIWFRPKKENGNEWEKIDFEGSPFTESDEVVKLVQNLNTNPFRMENLRSGIIWMALFTGGAIIGTWIGTRNRGAIRIWMQRMYRYARLR